MGRAPAFTSVLHLLAVLWPSASKSSRGKRVVPLRPFNVPLRFSPILRFTAVLLLALAGTGWAFCGEIHDAASSGDLAKLKTLLNGNPDLVFSKDEQGATPLHAAALTGNGDVAELLLDHRADVNARTNNGSTPLHYAAEKGHQEVAELLLTRGADVNAEGNDGSTPLHYAAWHGNTATVELLLAHRADVNAKETGGFTALHNASSLGHKDVVELLLSHGADVNAKSNDGWTPLHSAANHGYKDVAELLLARGADVNATKNNGCTPLCQAAYAGQTDVAGLLLGHQADVNARENNFWTPLREAVAHNHEEVAKLLRENGAQDVCSGVRAWRYFHAYAGPTVPREQLAVLDLRSRAAVLSVDGSSVDCPTGRKDRGDYAFMIEVRPGLHVVTFGAKREAVDPITKELSLEAGKTYKVEADTGTCVPIGNGMERCTLYKSGWKLKITEK